MSGKPEQVDPSAHAVKSVLATESEFIATGELQGLLGSADVFRMWGLSLCKEPETRLQPSSLTLSTLEEPAG